MDDVCGIVIVSISNSISFEFVILVPVRCRLMSTIVDIPSIYVCFVVCSSVRNTFYV